MRISVTEHINAHTLIENRWREKLNTKGLKKNKVYKMIVRLITGAIIIIYFTINGILTTQQVKAAPIKSDYTISYTVANTTALSATIEKEMNLTKSFEEIAKIYNADVNIIREVHKVEKLFNLPKHSFMGQVNCENRFQNT